MATRTTRHYVAHIEADTQGTPNEALVHFDFDVTSTATIAQQAANIIAALSGVGETAINTAITGIDYTAPAAAGAVPLSFPVTEYGLLKAANAPLVAMTAYGVTYGAGAMAPIGTSATVNLYTTLPGRSGTGRHYRPWMSADVVDSGGELDSAYNAGILDATNAFLIGTASGPFVPVGPDPQLAVWSVLLAASNVVTVAKVSQEFARLRSRMR